MDIVVALPVIFRDHSGDNAALITKINPADPNILDSIDTVDLVVFRDGIFIPIPEKNVAYSLNTYGTFRNLGDEWDDTQDVSASVDKDQEALPSGTATAEDHAVTQMQRAMSEAKAQTPAVPGEQGNS